MRTKQRQWTPSRLYVGLATGWWYALTEQPRRTKALVQMEEGAERFLPAKRRRPYELELST